MTTSSIPPEQCCPPQRNPLRYPPAEIVCQQFDRFMTPWNINYNSYAGRLRKRAGS